MTDNRDKDKPLDESVLDETPPNINEPQKDAEEHTDDDKVPATEPTVEEDKEDKTPEPAKEEDEKEEDKQEDKETPDQKEQRYKAQQTEAQIQAARNRALTEKVDEAAKITEPTVEELKSYVASNGIDWDDLTPTEQLLTKKTYIAEKRFDVVNQSVQESKKIDEWASKVDTFIDSTDGKPEYVQLSGHEADFRKFSMKESHRGTPIDILLGAFLHQLPPPEKKRGSLLLHGGGGEKNETPGKIVDADTASTLRATNPREWRRQVKLGNIKVEA